MENEDPKIEGETVLEYDIYDCLSDLGKACWERSCETCDASKTCDAIYRKTGVRISDVIAATGIF